MKFARLRLSGFKSFVEPTELEIKPGLTGVVGPNGCGKSNLLEALRWVMGESSYKSMRATGMDDVIFSGTRNRPARNMAEVLVTLDNTDHTAPPMYNAEEMIEVSRRIEREAGSAYRINGKDSRARDVQLLFADASTGARSPALVRQGQISELISAKPQNRRKILEEAAGISGLHTRRHDAELKLRAAETNLTRLDDVTAQLETQLRSLKRQARQAVKYKQLSSEIRQLEGVELYLDWREADATLAKTRAELEEVQRLLAGFTAAVNQKTLARDKAEAALPPLREAETVRTAVLQRLTIEREGLERREREATERRDELDRRLEQINRDVAREQEILSDVDEALQRLNAEAQALGNDQGADADTRAEAATEVQRAAEELANLQEQFETANAALSDINARRRAIENAIAAHTAQFERSEREYADVTARHDDMLAKADAASDLKQLAAAVASAETALAEKEASATEAERRLAALRQTEAEARREYDEAKTVAGKLSTEVQTLTKLLQVNDAELWPPVIDALTVTEGYETALGAALGDDLDASGDTASPVHWRALPELDATTPLPDGCEPLSTYVSGPEALDRRLAHVGVVNQEDGARAQAELKPGQRLVSLNGGLWRWDGYTAAADAPTPAAKRLAERNRLGALSAQSEAAQNAANAARERWTRVRDQVEAARGSEQSERSDWRQATATLDNARKALAERERAMSEQLQQASALKEAARRLAEARDAAKDEREKAKAQLAEIADTSAMEAELATMREKVSAAQTTYSDARARHDTIEREAKLRSARLDAIADERKSWAQRTERARQQLDELSRRAEQIRTEREQQSDLPTRFEGHRKALMSKLADAEAQLKTASDELAEGETAFKHASDERRKAESALAETREQLARLETLTETSTERRSECRQRIVDKLECHPKEVLERLEIDPDNLPSPTEAEKELTGLRHQRERLGAVNLRAEEEANEVAENLDTLTAERDDVVTAINKLRSAISSLNKEGRARLLEAFDSVNAHFETLFTTLFAGGKARLELVESDDPLEAGLEIIANPPGKRPTTLSLLSGGEQALTAMALIFAVFLTNPSPICVLDEVDAPLDDHNVERFCNLLDAMLEKADTRFLIITHHALTMSRMNRLYGVTMAERGVSQLVSVDLDAAERLREAG